MRHSLYWDDFQKRANETLDCLYLNNTIPVRRVAIFITDRCNMSCSYCNHLHKTTEMSELMFDSIVKKYGNDAIIHITGGEPSIVKWLYPYLEQHGNNYRFHLNTNAFIMPPAKFIKRLKVSLDSNNAAYWNSLTGTTAFWTVVNNIKKCCNDTVVSITYTMTNENYKSIPDFIKFAQEEFKNLYAIFFSVYKGDNPRFVFTDTSVLDFFDNIKPIMDNMLDAESKALLNETITEKIRLIQGERFPENNLNKCYLSLSERVFTPSGVMSGCSHLMRDGILIAPGEKHEKCKYGCNRRLVAFNDYVQSHIEK